MLAKWCLSLVRITVASTLSLFLYARLLLSEYSYRLRSGTSGWVCRNLNKLVADLEGDMKRVAARIGGHVMPNPQPDEGVPP